MSFEMIEKRVLKQSAPYAKLAGLWPGQNIRFVYVSSIFVYAVVIFATITQVSRIVIYWSADVLLEQLQFLCIPLALYIKHTCYAMNRLKFKAMFGSIVSDWQNEKTKEEGKIIGRYADRAVFFIQIYIANAYFVATSFFLVPFVPFILDVILPLNESRPRVHMYEGYYYVKNQDEYYFPIMIYTLYSLMVATGTFIAADTILIYLVQHSCGLLHLSGYRIRLSLDEWLTSCEPIEQDRRRMYDNVTYAIRTHERALRFLSDLDSRFRLAIFLQMGLIVTNLTVTLLRAASVTLSLETYQFYAYAIAQLVHILFLTAQGQLVINEHDSIYRKGYEMAWYKSDIRTQLLLVLIQRRNLNPPLLTAGGLIQLNFDSFAQILKASVSYFTVLKSV